GGVNLEGILEKVELKAIRQALARAGGNKTRAAQMLGMSFRAFRYRLAKLGEGGE
ncbi:MAG: helix-turn-helix domain-containing protein, partial [Magnetococcales bacterium]|nr:helix-turn-helix domain-containing protein [Magnetococcales bacterium]